MTHYIHSNTRSATTNKKLSYICVIFFTFAFIYNDYTMVVRAPCSCSFHKRWWVHYIQTTLFWRLLHLPVNSCKTPNGIGECKPIPDCPPLHSIFNQKPLTPAKADFLRNHSCGFQGSIPKVCCVVSAELVEPNSLLPDPSSCGHLIDAKIIGGKQTAIDEFPWMALLEYQHGNYIHKVNPFVMATPS